MKYKWKYYRVVPAFGDKVKGEGYFILLYSKGDNVPKDVVDGSFPDVAAADQYAVKEGLKKL